MCEVCYIIRMFKVETKRKGVVCFFPNSFYIILNVLYLRSASCPSVIVALTANINFHSILVRRIVFQ